MHPSRQRWRCTLNTFKCFINISLALLGFFPPVQDFYSPLFSIFQLKKDFFYQTWHCFCQKYTPFTPMLILYFELSSSVSYIYLHPYFLPSFLNVYSAVSYLSYSIRMAENSALKWCICTPLTSDNPVKQPQVTSENRCLKSPHKLPQLSRWCSIIRMNFSSHKFKTWLTPTNRHIHHTYLFLGF